MTTLHLLAVLMRMPREYKKKEEVNMFEFRAIQKLGVDHLVPKDSNTEGLIDLSDLDVENDIDTLLRQISFPVIAQYMQRSEARSLQNIKQIVTAFILLLCEGIENYRNFRTLSKSIGFYTICMLRDLEGIL